MRHFGLHEPRLQSLAGNHSCLTCEQACGAHNAALKALTQWHCYHAWIARGARNLEHATAVLIDAAWRRMQGSSHAQRMVGRGCRRLHFVVL